MAEGEIGHLRASLSANHVAFESDLKKAREAVQKHASGMEKAMFTVGKQFDSVIGKIGKLGTLASTVAVGGFAALVAKQIDAASSLEKFAQSTGVSVEFLSSLTLAAKLADTSLESIGKSIEKLSKNMKDAGEESGDAKEAFAMLGISIKNQDGTLKDADKIFMEIADKFSKLPDGAEKTALAMRMFGKSGAELIPVLNMGAAGIKEMQDRAEEMGLTISTETAKQAAYLKDQIDTLKLSGEGFARTIGLAIVPQINEMINVFNAAAKSGGALAGALAVVKNISDEFSRRAAILTASRKLSESIQEYEEFRKKPIQLGFVEERLKKEIAERKARLDELMAEEAKREKAEKEALESSLERQRKEQEARQANLEAMIKADEKRKQLEAERKAAEDAEKKRQETITKTIESLEKQAETYGLSATQIKLYELNQLGANKAQMEAAEVAAKNIEYQEALTEAEQNRQSYLKAQEEAARSIYEATRTAAEKAIELMAQLDDLYSQGVIDYDLWARGYAKAMDDWNAATEKTADKMDELQRAIEGWGKDSAKAIVDFCKGGKTSFSDLIDSIISDIMRMMVYQNITKPLFGWISSGVTSTLTGLGLSAKGNVFSDGHLIPYAKGGIVMKPTVFPMATGAGLMGEAGPEAVMPLARLSTGELGVKATGSGEGVSATIININAVDAKSFEDMCRRNPNAIIGPVTEGLKANQQRKQWRNLING